MLLVKGLGGEYLWDKLRNGVVEYLATLHFLSKEFFVVTVWCTHTRSIDALGVAHNKLLGLRRGCGKVGNPNAGTYNGPMSKAILADARRRRLMEQLLEHGSITVGDSAAEFGVSTETIRKDILHLEKLGLAQKRFGGAVVSESAHASVVGTRKASLSNAKERIAARAVEFIPSGASVFIDGGTTTYSLSEALSSRDDLTVFTNSMSAIGPLSHSKNELFIVGGRLQTPEMSNVGAWAVQAIQGTNIDIAFLGTDGLRGTAGPTSANYDEAAFKANVIASSGQTFVLADSSKFEQAGLFVYSNWRDIDFVVTDEDVSPRDRESLERETSVVIAENDAISTGAESGPVAGELGS